MYKGSFFVNFEFNETVAGFHGNFTGDKLYSIQHFEIVEDCINDVYKIMKTKDHATITFDYFNNGSTNLCRLYREYDGSIVFVNWTEKNVFTSEPNIVKDIELTKKNIKKYVLRAIELFIEKDSEAA